MSIDRIRTWKPHKKIMKKNDWDQITNADVVLGPIQKVTHVETIYTVKIKLKRASGPS